MALGDKFLFEVAKKAVLCGLSNDLDTLFYRQHILKDCLKNPSIVRDIYHIAVEAIENKKRHYYGIFSHYPSSILSSSIEMLQMFMGLLKKLKSIAEEQADKFESEGFTASQFFYHVMENAIFLRAERQTDGGRSFKITPGEPLQTRYGEDLYNRIFGTDC
jgi:hypothetical protein